MKNESKIILKKMGFKQLAHILWKHEGLGTIIAFEDSTEPYDIAVNIFQQGEKHKIAELKTLLEINH